MNAGKALFAQVMEFGPWKACGRIIERHRGDAGGLTQLRRIDWKADVLNLWSWRIHHALAMHLIDRARTLYAQVPMTVYQDVSVDALNSATSDLCLSLFGWAPLRSTKGQTRGAHVQNLQGLIVAGGTPAKNSFWFAGSCLHADGQCLPKRCAKKPSASSSMK